jgi:hypothetical protein
MQLIRPVVLESIVSGDHPDENSDIPVQLGVVWPMGSGEYLSDCCAGLITLTGVLGAASSGVHLAGYSDVSIQPVVHAVIDSDSVCLSIQLVVQQAICSGENLTGDCAGDLILSVVFRPIGSGELLAGFSGAFMYE